MSEPEVDHREPVASSENESELEAEGIPQRVESSEEEVVVPHDRDRAGEGCFSRTSSVNGLPCLRRATGSPCCGRG